MRRNQFTDRQLLDSLESGDTQQEEQAFHYLYSENYSSIQFFILRNGGSEDDALDTFQDAMVILYNQIKEGRFKAASTLKTYVFAIAKYLWFQAYKKKERYDLKSEFPQEASVELNKNDLSGLSVSKTINQLLEELDYECREILQLFYFKEKNMTEIQRHFDLGSEQAAKNKKYKCLKKLVVLFDKYKLTRDRFSDIHE